MRCLGWSILFVLCLAGLGAGCSNQGGPQSQTAELPPGHPQSLHSPQPLSRPLAGIPRSSPWSAQR
jgi:hypothetical protein